MRRPEPRFGTDGVRGVANVELTPGLALRLGVAAATVLVRHGDERHVVVGRDTRLSGQMLESALAAGLASAGCRVSLLGVVPTPCVARSVAYLGAAAGAVVSASHNPFPDNGIKFFGPLGTKLDDAVEDEIEAALESDEAAELPSGAGIGRIEPRPDAVDAYARAVAATSRVSLDGLRLVLDCANGATCSIAPVLYRALGAEVWPIHADPNGVNINDGCGSTHPGSLCQEVIRVGADAGLAFDGDGDRVILCDEEGRVVDGDHAMAICAIAMRKRGELPGDRVVATIMSNAGLDLALERHGILLDRTDVGDRYVHAEMVRTGAALGGEQSGHLLFPALTPTGDGMVTGLRVLAEMKSSGQPLSKLASVMATVPQRLRNVRVRSRDRWRDDPEIVEAIENARARVSKPEWLSVRASGTEPLVRVMAQDTDGAIVDEVVDGLCDLLQERHGVG